VRDTTHLTGAAAFGPTLAAALLEDMLPPSSGHCAGVGGENSNTFDFMSSDSTSLWDETSEMYEEKVFLAKMSHVDPNANRSWTLRVGKAGNIYSFVGPSGIAFFYLNCYILIWIRMVNAVCLDWQNEERKSKRMRGMWREKEQIERQVFGRGEGDRHVYDAHTHVSQTHARTHKHTHSHPHTNAPTYT